MGGMQVTVDLWDRPVIPRFDGEYGFLSNFYPASTPVGDVIWPSAEHAYQSRKCANLADVHKFHGITAGQAKRLGRKIPIRADWNFIKNTQMLFVVRAKFVYNHGLAKQLLATGDSILEEGNTWGDKYWGVCEGEGLNWLGNILMHVREELRNNG